MVLTSYEYDYPQLDQELPTNTGVDAALREAPEAPGEALADAVAHAPEDDLGAHRPPEVPPEQVSNFMHFLARQSCR